MILEDIERGILEKLEDLKKTPANPDGVFTQVDSFAGDMEEAVKRLLTLTGCLVMYSGGDMDAVNRAAGKYLHEANYVILLGLSVHGGEEEARMGRGRYGKGLYDIMGEVVKKIHNQSLGLNIIGLEFTGVNVLGIKGSRVVFGMPVRTVCLWDTG